MSFAADLERARADRKPCMALRPKDNRPDELDDIVVHDVHKFRAEAMDDKTWWLACYFHNGERVTFNVHLERKPPRVSLWLGEVPAEWTDIDKRSG